MMLVMTVMMMMNCCHFILILTNNIIINFVLRKHMSSTFIPMIGGYMSEDELKHHVDHQLSLEQKKYEPEEEPIVEEQVNLLAFNWLIKVKP